VRAGRHPDPRRGQPRALSRAAGAGLAGAEDKGPVTFPVAGPVLLPQVTCDGKEARGALRPDGTGLFPLPAALAGAARRRDGPRRPGKPGKDQ
jgi:hypothetical protein